MCPRECALEDTVTHAGWRTLLQSVEEQIGEQEGCEMVEGEGALEALSRDVPGVPVATDVIDQHVDPGKALQHFGSEPPHLGLGGQVRHEHIDRPTPGCADLARPRPPYDRGPGR